MADAVLEGKMNLTNLTREERVRIKNALTIPNPAYAAAKKYSKSGYVTRVPENLFYYQDKQGVLSVPIGFDVLRYCELDNVEDRRIINEVDYPKFIFTLRDDQKKAFDQYDKLNDGVYKSIPKGLIQLATGKGKSILGIYIARMFRQKTLVLVHKNDLVLAWRQDIHKCFNGNVTPGLIKEKSRVIGKQITIATIQTLNRWQQEDLTNLFNEFGLVICDEVHHVGASSYIMVSKFNSMYKLGLSATPERADGLTPVMNFYFGDFAYQYHYVEDDKDILPVEVIVRNSPFKYAPCINKNNKGAIENLFVTQDGQQIIRKEPGLIPVDSMPYDRRPDIRYHEIDNEVLKDHSYAKMVLGDIESEYNLGKNCVVFFSQKEWCYNYYLVLSSRLGSSNVQLFYGDSVESDETILSRAESGECRVTLTTYSKGTEGTNCRAWDTAFLVSSVNSEKNVEQAIGRIRRVKKGKPDKARVFDYRHPYVYLWQRHGITRDKRYKHLKFEIYNAEREKFSRGYHN